MDEVENPALPAADESSPTIPPIADDTQPTIPLVSPDNEPLLSTDPGEPEGPPPKPPRPTLKRDSSSGSSHPVQQPPPAPPPTSTEELVQDPPDSLTLADLKRIRSSFPTATTPLEREQLLNYRRVYDFEYQDAQSFPVELEEWFSYSEEEDLKLRRCRTAFNEQWRATEEGRQDWLDVSEDSRREYVEVQIEALRHGEEEAVISALQNLTYIALGVWEETAGREEGAPLKDFFPNSNEGGAKLEDYGSSSLQIQWIVSMVDTLRSCGALKAIYETLRKICEDDFQSAPPDMPGRSDSIPRRADESTELWCCLTLMYLFVEIARTTDGLSGQTLKNDILALEPNFLNYLTQIVARLRWDETAPIPLTKMLLLAWKTILVSFGGIKDIEHIKSTLREDKDEMDARGKPIITASPLDYHLFRQEINSKYPAYQPPEPLFPLEPENNSILPPLKHRRPSTISDASFASAPSAGNGSIMHQPVHIATPAPSPPPSPGGPGKAGKKQNYQTNQMFPFLYPPLDENSNELGGKGSTELQDALVGRRWEGTDIPTSILEAAELFAKRMRATRGMKQLWETRVDYMKYERGWKGGADLEDNNNDVDDFELLPKPAEDESAEQGEPLPQTDEQRKLNAVNEFYRESLPHLQSVVIVLLKAVLQNVTELVTKGNGQNGLQAGFQFNEPNGINGSVKPVDNGNGHVDNSESTAEELDKLRSQEIAAKALSAILLLLLKWFKVNHILQYEYMTQLLLDSNYVPLILKLWQTHEIGRACHYPLDREESSFFYFCQSTSRQGAPKPKESKSTAIVEDDSEDDAAPPPIKMSRDDAEPAPFLPEPEYNLPPEIDELGYPQTPLPASPINSYSWRNVFTAINYLRVLQKITRRKTHRSLLLVSYKSSIHLKKTLKIPVHQLRYYTLKLFKSQVPFCGRKWRQGNMKIITAVWLSVPAELRDDWLSGGGGGMGGACIGDVDGTVEDALPLEQSLRALTHWWNVRNFREAMGVDEGLVREEDVGFFERELEKLDVARVMLGEEEGEGGEGEWHGPVEGY
ncbi:hypothetical protein Q7P37_010504 [Cladosporium fusiforme]